MMLDQAHLSNQITVGCVKPQASWLDPLLILAHSFVLNKACWSLAPERRASLPDWALSVANPT